MRDVRGVWEKDVKKEKGAVCIALINLNHINMLAHSNVCGIRICYMVHNLLITATYADCKQHIARDKSYNFAHVGWQ